MSRPRFFWEELSGPLKSRHIPSPSATKNATYTRKQFHNPKDLAISVSLEASELLELFQWSGADLEAARKKPEMTEELADVMIYCIYMANALNIDIPEAIRNKIDKNAAKYPVEKAKGKSKKYTEL